MKDNYYDTIANSYDELYGNEQIKKLELILYLLQKEKLLKGKSTLLDIGCGSGISTRFFKDRLGLKCTGIDPSEKLIRIARQKEKQISFVKGFGESLPFGDESFDVITSITAIQNFTDQKKAVQEIDRVCQNTGVIIITCLKAKRNIEELFKAHFIIISKIVEEKDTIFFLAKRLF